ncbi:MAG: Zn-dependent hydrolase [Acidimicrobiales bacterium]
MPRTVPASSEAADLGARLRVDIDRLVGRLAALAEIGAITGTEGCARLALTDEDRAGRDLVVAWMHDLGLEVRIDRIGNVVATLAGETDGPPVMCGSHIDTVRSGGRYDGNLGVLAGLEVIETILGAGLTPRRPIAVGFFTDEEGARFAPDMLGSLVYVGGMALEEALEIEGIDGAVLGAELDRIGYAGAAPVPGLVPHAFVELHVEQGPVLEAEGITIGAVDGVQGISWQELTITGQSNHAGTTPMTMRRDPGYVAAAVTTFVRELAVELGAPQVGTVGMVALAPNLVNVVPASATITVDLRNTDDTVLQEAERRLAEFVTVTAEAEGCTVETRSLARFEPVIFDPMMVDLVASTAADLGHSVRRMPSGAGHDAQMLARVCPTAMIFTPSKDGLSHNPAEYTSPEDLRAGADVLLRVMWTLANDADADDDGGDDPRV